MVGAILLHGQMRQLRFGAESWWDAEQGQMKGVGHTLGFPGDSDSKASTCNVGDMSLTPRLGRYIHCAESENFIFTFLRFYFSMYIGVCKSSRLKICVIRSSSFDIVFL